MIKLIERYFKNKDDRGALEGLINFGEWKEINMVTSVENCIRGNHYHRNTKELFIILDGSIRVIVQKVENQKLTGQAEEKIVNEGDVFIVEPFTNHTFYILKSARWINVLSEPIDKNSSDIHKAK